MSIPEGLPLEGSDEASSDIDAEWALLNHELDHPSEPYMEELEARERLSEIIDEVFKQLSQCDTLRVLDIDEEAERELRSRYLETIRREKVETMEGQRAWSPTEVTAEDHIQILRECLIEYDERRDVEALLIRDLSNLVLLERFPNDSEICAVLSEKGKKHLQASLAVSQKYDYDHPFQKLIEEKLPNTPGLEFYIYTDDKGGQRVGVFNENDRQFVVAAEDNHAEQSALFAKKRWKIKEAQALLDIPSIEENTDQVLALTLTCIKLHIVSTWEAHSQGRKLKKLNTLWEIAHELEYPDELLSRVIELFDDTESF